MSELKVWSELSERQKRIAKVVGGIMGAGALLGLIILGERGFESDIVGGVYGQVEERRHITTGGVGTPRDTSYYLGIEQCRADVEAAKNGNPGQKSYDPRLGEVASGCLVDEVRVGHDTYQKTNKGDEIILAGDPNTYWRK